MLNEFLKKEAPIHGLAGMGGGVPSRLLTLASGTTTYVDDVFSIDVFDGNGSSQTITNGIDLAGKGGMVWGKTRTTTVNHTITDTERGVDKELFTNSTDPEVTRATGTGSVTAFNSNGFTTNATNGFINYSGHNACSWTFRKCPGFFDVVTYTGNGTGGLSISHNLGSVPGFIMVKRTSGYDGWFCYHRSLGNTKMVALNGSGAAGTATQYWNDTSPTDTTFTVGTDTAVNANGVTYVAYLFAHNDGSFGEDSDEAVIKCGSFEGSAGTTVNLGFEPQWILVKRIDGAYNWNLYDNMRGLPGGSDLNAEYLEPNTNIAENDHRSIFITPTGFEVSTSTAYNTDTHVYIAIRRPHKPPESATECFDIQQTTGNNVNARHIAGTSGSSPTDLHFIKRVNDAGEPAYISSRLQGNLTYKASENEAAVNSVFGSSLNPYDVMNGIKVGQDGGMNSSSNTYVSHFFSRKPGFMDVVIYKGASGAQTINHNLGVTPEFIIIKKTSEASYYEATIYHGTTGNLFLNDQTSGYGGSNAVNHSTISATTFEVKSGNIDVNDDGETHAAYLFASLDGISKVGSYSGTGSAHNIDCGFTNGARFVLIKRTDTADSWHLFDTVQGINSGADPYYRLDLGAAQVTGNDRIDPLDAGFTLADGDGGTNASGGTYFFLAIA